MQGLFITGVAVVPPDADLAAARFARRPPRFARMDRLCALAIVAAEGALAAAGHEPVIDRLAVVTGTRFGCHATNEAYYRGLLKEGVRGASPKLFAYTLPSSPLGEVAIHLGARGPGETVASGRHAGLEALIRGARLCESGRADAALVIAVEVGGGTLPALGLRCEDGAVAILLEKTRERARAELAGGGSAFVAGDPEAARSLALRHAQEDAGTSNVEVVEPTIAEGDGAVDAMMAIARFLDGGTASTNALVSVADVAGGAAAILLRTIR